MLCKLGKKWQTKKRLKERNNKTPFATCVLPKCGGKEVNTRYGMFQIDLLLSFHFNQDGFTTNILTNIPELACLHWPHMNCPNYYWASLLKIMALSEKLCFHKWWKSLSCDFASYREKEAICFRTRNCYLITTAQKMKFSTKDIFSKCDQIHKKLRIWSIYWRNP